MTDTASLQTQAHAAAALAATGSYASPVAVATLVRLLDQYLADLHAGRQPDRERLRAEHPELAAELEQCLSGIDFVHRAASATDSPVQLGDFHIVRELGRGGMGVVYEAEQLSLRRRVALKVLRFGGVADPEAMKRFQREAETVARLHHTNIVPIFSVGCEQGVHYYAMQYIEGRTLTAELNEAGTGLDARQVAALGLQAAEALVHAHQRGVIHRDIKPSNLLLDRERVLWLTDFGLARRLDEVTLTVAGALMGTPRYMSPEQAAATRQPVDHRTDVYSLGATLYELLTGKPVFDAATPQAVLTQILHAEPVAPGRLVEKLPSELETIVLTCLAKEPERRYATAQALAEDLRAFLDGRPIRARRPSLVERALRWARKHRRSAALMAVAAVAAMLLMFGGLLALREYQRWQTGTLLLDGDTPGLTGELLDEEGRPVQPRFTIPTEEPLALPAGTYQLRVSGRGYLDETFQVRIERGQELAFTVGLKDQRLWEPIQIEGTYECMRFGEREDILVLSSDGVTRRHGGTGAVLWSTRLDGKNDPRLAGWRWDWDTRHRPSGRNELDRRPHLVQPGPDLDGDGVPDLVWMNRRQAAVLALSGKTGKVLWCFQGPLPKKPADDLMKSESASTGITLGVAVMPDVNRDGVHDLIATFASQEEADGQVPRWVEALSGRTGESLWRFELDAAWFRMTGNEPAPAEARWDNRIGLGSTSTSTIITGYNQLYDRDWAPFSGGVAVPYPAEVTPVGGTPTVVLVAGTRLLGLDPASGRTRWEPHNLGFWPLRSPQLANLDGRNEGNILLLGFGKEEGESKKYPAPDPEATMPSELRRLLPPHVANGLPHETRTDDRLTLVTLALATRQLRWEVPFRGYWGWNWFQEPFTWPVIADLDGDGRLEVIVPTGEVEGKSKWSGVQVCEGATGAVRWVRRLSRSQVAGQVQQANRILVGQHADADGCLPIFTALLDGDSYAPDNPYSSFQVANFDKDYANPVLLVDALSGKDGRTLWWARQHMPSASLSTFPKPSIGPLRWWYVEADGWPQLIVPYVPGSPQDVLQPHPVYFLSGRTGRVLHVGADYRELRTVDLNGDGTLDLLSFRPDEARVYDRGGTLETIRGRSPEAWRRLGGTWQFAGDLDGDGIPDLVPAPKEDRTGSATSGEPFLQNVSRGSEAGQRRDKAQRGGLQSKAISSGDGRVLWQRTIQDEQRHTPWETPFFTNLVPLAQGIDLDGDGVPDLLATGSNNSFNFRQAPSTPLLAVSGRTGKLLWTADIAVELCNGPQLVQCRDLDGDGQPEVLFVCAMDWGWERPPGAGKSSDEWQYWLTVLNGRDGRVRWKQPLCDRDHAGSMVVTTPFACVLADLNGDGVLDIIIEAAQPGRDSEVRAFSGKDGSLLWSWKPPAAGVRRGSSDLSRPTLAVGALDESGRPVVVLLRTLQIDNPQGRPTTLAEVVALEGGSGVVKWNWREPVDWTYNGENGSAGSRVTPLIVHLAGGKRAVCVWTYHYKAKAQIFLLDARGKEWQRRSVTFRLNGKQWELQQKHPDIHPDPVSSGLFRVWAVDWTGEGIDDLVYFGEDRLCVLSDGLTRTRYEWPLPNEDCDLLQIIPKTQEHPAFLPVRAGGQVVFLGMSGGRPDWVCTGSGIPRAVAWGSNVPRVVYDLGHEVTALRVALATAETSAERPMLLAPGEDDPRFVTPLPWCPLHGVPPLLPTSPICLAGALLGICLAVLVVPAVAWTWAARRRAWLLCLLPVVWLGLVWGAALLVFLAQLEDEAKWQIYNVGEWGFVWRLGRGVLSAALAGLPVAGFALVAARALRWQRWGRLALLAGAVLLLAVGVGVVWLHNESWSVLGPEQHYSWKGWWAIWPAGMYVTGLLILVGLPVPWVVRLGQAGRRRLWHG